MNQRLLHLDKLGLSVLLVAMAVQAHGQVLLSGGTYTQNFDSPVLANASAQGTNWNHNATLLGWYAETSFGAITNYRVSTGGVNNGSLYSYGVAGQNLITERALGSLGSGTYNNLAYGRRMQNDTVSIIDSFTISYVGEQWRNGAPTTPAAHTLAFSYRSDSLPITSPDWANTGSPAWTSVTALDFVGPVLGGVAAAMDGNLPANRIALSTTISGLSLSPGQEIFFRWFDLNDVSNDHGLAVDDLTISYSVVPEPAVGTLLGLGLLALAARLRSARAA